MLPIMTNTSGDILESIKHDVPFVEICGANCVTLKSNELSKRLLAPDIPIVVTKIKKFIQNIIKTTETKKPSGITGKNKYEFTNRFSDQFVDKVNSQQTKMDKREQKRLEKERKFAIKERKHYEKHRKHSARKSDYIPYPVIVEPEPMPVHYGCPSGYYNPGWDQRNVYKEPPDLWKKQLNRWWGWGRRRDCLQKECMPPPPPMWPMYDNPNFNGCQNRKCYKEVVVPKKSCGDCFAKLCCFSCCRSGLDCGCYIRPNKRCDDDEDNQHIEKKKVKECNNNCNEFQCDNVMPQYTQPILSQHHPRRHVEKCGRRMNQSWMMAQTSSSSSTTACTCSQSVTNINNRRSTKSSIEYLGYRIQSVTNNLGDDCCCCCPCKLEVNNNCCQTECDCECKATGQQTDPIVGKRRCCKCCKSGCTKCKVACRACHDPNQEHLHPYPHPPPPLPPLPLPPPPTEDDTNKKNSNTLGWATNRNSSVDKRRSTRRSSNRRSSDRRSERRDSAERDSDAGRESADRGSNASPGRGSGQDRGSDAYKGRDSGGSRYSGGERDRNSGAGRDSTNRDNADRTSKSEHNRRSTYRESGTSKRSHVEIIEPRHSSDSKQYTRHSNYSHGNSQLKKSNLRNNTHSHSAESYPKRILSSISWTKNKKQVRLNDCPNNKNRPKTKIYKMVSTQHIPMNKNAETETKCAIENEFNIPRFNYSRTNPLFLNPIFNSPITGRKYNLTPSAIPKTIPCTATVNRFPSPLSVNESLPDMKPPQSGRLLTSMCDSIIGDLKNKNQTFMEIQSREEVRSGDSGFSSSNVKNIKTNYSKNTVKKTISLDDLTKMLTDLKTTNDFKKGDSASIHTVSKNTESELIRASKIVKDVLEHMHTNNPISQTNEIFTANIVMPNVNYLKQNSILLPSDTITSGHKTQEISKKPYLPNYVNNSEINLHSEAPSSVKSFNVEDYLKVFNQKPSITKSQSALILTNKLEPSIDNLILKNKEVKSIVKPSTSYDLTYKSNNVVRKSEEQQLNKLDIKPEQSMTVQQQCDSIIENSSSKNNLSIINDSLNSSVTNISRTSSIRLSISSFQNSYTMSEIDDDLKPLPSKYDFHKKSFSKFKDAIKFVKKHRIME